MQCSVFCNIVFITGAEQQAQTCTTKNEGRVQEPLHKEAYKICHELGYHTHANDLY